MNKQELAEQILKSLAKRNGFSNWNEILNDYNKGFTSEETFKALILAAIVEAMGAKSEKKFTEVLSPQGNSYVSPNWWHDKPEEFPAEIIKHDGGVWGQYAAKTIYGNFALDKASIKFAPLWKMVDVRPYKAGYMMVEIIRPQQNNPPSSRVEAMGVQPGMRWVKASEPESLPKQLEFNGVIIKHNPAPELFGGVAVHTLNGDYAIIKADQERAAKLIGFKVKVRNIADCYKTVEILWKESKPPHDTDMLDKSPTNKEDVARDSSNVADNQEAIEPKGECPDAQEAHS